MGKTDCALDSFQPDWQELWTPAQAEAELRGFKFKGPGWYLSGDDTVLVIQPNAPAYLGFGFWSSDVGVKFWFFVYNHRNPRSAFNQICQAPVRSVTKQGRRSAPIRDVTPALLGTWKDKDFDYAKLPTTKTTTVGVKALRTIRKSRP